MAGQAGGPLGRGEGRHPLEVARPGGLEALEPSHGALAAGAQVVEGARGRQRLGGGPLGPGCRVERGHRRAHPGVEPVGDGAQVGADRLGGHLGRGRDRVAGGVVRVGEHVLDAHQQGLERRAGAPRGRPRRCAVPAASQSSTSLNAEMSKSRSSTSRRSSGVARRKAAKSPWGSSTTLANCARPMPRTSLTTSADLVVAGADAAPSGRRGAPRGRPWPAPMTVPVPRFFGRRNSGERVTRSRRRAGGELEHAPRARHPARRGRCAAPAAWRARRARRRRGRSRWRRAGWSCRRRWARG